MIGQLRVFVGLGLLVLLAGCGADSLDKEAALRQIAQERLGRIRANLQRDCREEVLEAANLLADSLLLDRARRLQRIAGRPPKPSRPGEPPERSLSADLPLRPLFPYEIRFDRLLREQLTLDSLLRDSLLVVDTLVCPDCALPTIEATSLEETEQTITPNVYDIYCLLAAREEACLENPDYATAYQKWLYASLRKRPRALELSLEALELSGDELDFYLSPLAELSIEPAKGDSLREIIRTEIVGDSLKQRLIEEMSLE